MVIPVTCIYVIRHVPSGKCYVGQTVNRNPRWRMHRHLLRKGTHYAKRLQRTWTRDGEEAFEFEVLEECPTELLTEREQFWMDSLSPAYNIAPAGGKQTGLRWKNSPETIERRAATLRGRVMSEEIKAKISAAKTGVPCGPMSEATKEKLRARGFSPEHRARISAAQRRRWAEGYYDSKKLKAVD